MGQKQVFMRGPYNRLHERGILGHHVIRKDFCSGGSRTRPCDTHLAVGLDVEMLLRNTHGMVRRNSLLDFKESDCLREPPRANPSRTCTFQTVFKSLDKKEEMKQNTHRNKNIDRARLAFPTRMSTGKSSIL